MKACLGLDTSNYMTSVALCSASSGTADGPFFQKRRLLSVPTGERGLMQSEAVFQHVSRLPELLRELLDETPAEIVAVCASVRPRPAKDSYMPVFRVGEGTGRSLAAALGVPFVPTSHQEGHLRAARVDTALEPDTPAVAVHLSGGTSEVVLAEGGAITLLGGTADLHAGQLIDRVGVAMGMAFPAGPALEKLAMRGHAAGKLPASVQGMTCHLSGAEAQAFRWIETATLPPEDIAAEVFDCIARTVLRLVLAACEKTGISDVLLGGGVTASHWLRQALNGRMAKRNRHIRLHFGRPDLSGDNAVGVALIGRDRMQGFDTHKEDGHGSTDH